MRAGSKQQTRSGTGSLIRTPEFEATRAPAMPGSYEPDTRASEGQPVIVARQPSLDDDVLDVTEVARLMRVGRNKVYELVGRNEIPHRRLGKQIRFSRAAIMRWLNSWSTQGAKEGQ